ncbi:MAG: TRAP transporter small permease [Deltaproteobacteria bacterium]|nr:TRAP transporter small permease [Deltaproteobacteria bacterium]
MFAFEKGVHRLTDLLNLVAGACLVAMTILTCADVVLRLFRHPILGTYEIIGFLGATVAGFAMAYTTVKGGHVAVAVVVMRLSPRVQKVIFIITQLLGMVLFALLTWECVKYGNDLRTSGEVSLTLELPFFPVLYGLSLSAFMVCLVLWMDLWRVFTKRREPWARNGA